ncbi:D-tyrosyl-tRNA(Tyr) deacylase [Pelagicoccus sp. NFK12]|uniref:D-aminoacyl-tRNA deacylase n=1 Tax=Pelagicoccus enzymogenes TaxID=2773457 RepID=A0A927F7F9_9BACT|nr:D-aminoacyl-tRNA deacylase [Pelagicoccus enzymogenes]MBD5778611.1 D-tyrosyl-tRNA(Tyr) deacylase [Pelagicoccus enzymogenes]MDQ8197017.1 D-aminoacyl-tRNA deacylase [Pelagicoccus enzymogenes]
MKAVIQRVTRASVTIGGKLHSSIGPGSLVLLGIHKDDTAEDVEWIARKIANLRIFEDPEGRMNQSLADIDGELLVISQFTLIASNKKGNRPSFNDAAPPEKGKADYEAVCQALNQITGKNVQTGVFAADMKVDLLNDGPVTILFDTRNKE